MPDQITQLLDDIDRLDRETTKGPWRLQHVMGGDYLVHGDEDIAEAWGEEQAAFIALSRTALPALAQAVRSALELHKPVDIEPQDTICHECSEQQFDGGYFDLVEYPCPTVQAITDALKGQDDE